MRFFLCSNKRLSRLRRNHWSSHCARSTYLLLLIIITTFHCLSAANDGNVTENDHEVTDSEPHTVWRMEHLIHDDELDMTSEQGLLQLTANHLDIKALTTKLGHNFLLLVLVHDETCSACLAMQQRMTEAAVLYRSIVNDKLQMGDAAQAHFGMLLVKDLKEEWITAIDSVPSLFFLTSADPSGMDVSTSHQQNQSTLVLLEYSGLATRDKDIIDTVLFYSWRLQQLSTQTQLGKDMVLQEVPVLEHSFHLHDFLLTQRDIMLHLLRPDSIYQSPLVRTGLAATGDWSDLELRYMEWLFSSEATSAMFDDIKVFMLCQNERKPEFLTAFENIARFASNRRDSLFLKAKECGDAHIDIMSYSVPLESLESHDWALPPPNLFEADSVEHLSRYLLQASTPSLLGFDRQLTAPIAFIDSRKLHAVLFIDTHGITENPDEWSRNNYHLKQREAVAGFQSVCRSERRSAVQDIERDIVCLLVPSSETRVLMSFGMDYWTPLARQLFDVVDGRASSGEQSAFPTLLITDQRQGGTRLYYLEDDPTELNISYHFSRLWSGLLTPKRHSDERGPRTNVAGIRIVTGESVQDELFQDERIRQHRLVAFTSSTCGHCKRFKTIFNQLSHLLAHVGWSDLLSLYEMDVTRNDLIDLNVTIRWLPDLVYIPPNSRQLMAYNKTDSLGDGVGSLNDALQIFQWFIDVAPLSDFDIQGLLNELM